jgi:protein-tyrosine phosphatase
MNDNDAVGRHRTVEITDSEFRLLFVCTGNICRSPFAEILTRHLLAERLGRRVAERFHVSSAGVHAVVGAAMHPDSRAQLVPWGLHGAAEGFVARQLRSAIATSAHLVLGASPEHRSAVIGRAPATLATAFALAEFARLVSAVDPGDLPLDPVARAHAVVEEARARRGLLPPVTADHDRIPDPIVGDADAHRRSSTLIRTAVLRIVDAIAPESVAARPG